MANKYTKEKVSAYLDRARDYCDSHHDSVQSRFERHVKLHISDVARQRDMQDLYPVVADRTLRSFRPSLNVRKNDLSLGMEDGAAAFLDEWFELWIRKFLKAWEQLPSQKIGEPKKAATDPALVQLVLKSQDLNGSEIVEWVRHHNLFMSAENIGGNLLEEYIYSRVAQYEWIWCRGEILTAVDFCDRECRKFIQIKNKSNTENSSAKGFREGRNAAIWYRMKANRNREGQIVTMWPQLVEIVKCGCSRDVPDDLFSEADFQEFVLRAAASNPSLITGSERGSEY